MRRIRFFICHRKKAFGVFISVIIFFITFQFISVSYAQTDIGEFEPSESAVLQNELGGEVTEPDNYDNVSSGINMPEAAQTEVGGFEAVNAPVVINEVEVGTPDDLQAALNGDSAVIKVAPQNGDSIILNKALTIPTSRTVTLTADMPVSIVGASGLWMIITGENTDVSMRFINVAMDGGNSSGGIYSRGALTLQNAVIQNCNHPNGGSGIYCVGSLSVEGGRFVNNVGNPANYCDGGGIYVRGLKSRINVNIANCEFVGNSARYGGAVRVDNADAEIVDCIFSGNTAAQGAGIYAAAANTNVAGCTLTNNTGSGGAIFANISSVVILDSNISYNFGRGIYGYAENGDVEITVGGNTVIEGNYSKTSYGGGIIGYSWGDCKTTISINDNAIISNNEAKIGGGVSGFPGSNVIINLSGNPQITGNMAYENGGGIYGDGVLNVNGGSISSNTAESGGGVYCALGTKTNIANATISDNSAKQEGGGIWVANLAELVVNNSVFINNIAQTEHLWSVDNPADEKQLSAAAVNKRNISGTSYTAPFTNAYNNNDINYGSATVPAVYTVSYSGNGSGSGSPPEDANSPYLAGEDAIILPPGSMVKSGYTFTGWNAMPDGRGVNYSFDEKNNRFEPSTTPIGEENIALYAQWKKAAITTVRPSTSSGSTGSYNIWSILAPPKEIADMPENIAVPSETEVSGTEPIGVEEVLETIPEYPPVYQLAQTGEEVVELINENETPIGQWVGSENGWTYYAGSTDPQPLPLEDGSFEVIDSGGSPVGLWSKNEDEEWAYEEYAPYLDAGKRIVLPGLFLALASLLLLLYYFFIVRRHVTREGFVRMLMSAVHIDAETAEVTPYDDVDGNAVYYDAVMNAKAAGLLVGFTGSKLNPENAITREEIAGMLAETVRYLNVPVPAEQIDLTEAFTDFDKMNERFYADIKLVVLLNIMRQASGGRFEPDGLSYKEKAAKYINSLLAALSPRL